MNQDVNVGMRIIQNDECYRARTFKQTIFHKMACMLRSVLWGQTLDLFPESENFAWTSWT